MNRILFLLGLVAMTLGFAPKSQAAIVDAPVPGNAMISFGGFDWAWAGPCAPFSPSCGEIDLSYQAGQGWRLPTVAEMDAAIASAGGANDWVDLFFFAGANWAVGTDLGGRTNSFGEDMACASAYFSNNWEHCDPSDARNGYIYNWSGGQAPNAAEETFVLRVAAIPIPASLTLLLAGLGGLGAMRLRRKS